MNSSISIPNIYYPWIAIGVLIILYAVGVVSVMTGWNVDILSLTPLNLLISLAIVLCFHPRWRWESGLVLVAAYVIGLGSEIYGVATGNLFGEYSYGPILGWKLQHTPLMIGINWVMLIYCVGTTINRFAQQWAWWVKAGAGALVMVGLDYLIEPVAIAYDFWSWEGGQVPIKNYIGWFAISYILLTIFFRVERKTTNKVAFVLLILQFTFFALLGLA